jgi:hypothetical protein
MLPALRPWIEREAGKNHSAAYAKSATDSALGLSEFMKIDRIGDGIFPLSIYKGCEFSRVKQPRKAASEKGHGADQQEFFM